MKGRKGTQKWEPFNLYVNNKMMWAYLGAKANGQKQFLCAVRGPREPPTRKEVAYWLAAQNSTTLKRADNKLREYTLLLARYTLGIEDKLKFLVRVCFRPGNPEFGQSVRHCVEVVADGLGLKFPDGKDPIPMLAIWGKINGLF